MNDPLNDPLNGPPAGTDARTSLVLHGRRVVPGVAAGEALVSRQTISGWGGIDPERGVVIERRHELYGQSFAGKVLVFPGAKGSSGWAGFFQATRLAGTAPIAMVFTTISTKVALGAVVTRVPAVTDLDRDPVEVVETGDWVVVDADNGIVEVRPHRIRTDARHRDTPHAMTHQTTRHETTG